MTVSSHVQRGLDFTKYHTYEWGPADALPTGDPRLDKDPFFQDHMLGAVEKGLAEKGYQRVTAESADLLIHYHANIGERLDVDQRDRDYGYCYGDDCQAATTTYEAGTLVLDVVDARTKRVIWRGWAQESLGDILNNEDRMEKRINEAVARMLARLPHPL
jgi:hypothetical protein